MRGLRLLLASGNTGKLTEFREALPGVELLSLSDVAIRDLPPEAGTSYEENALLKAGFAAVHAGLPTLADDSGLEVDALDGAPGIHSARFGGELGDGERIALLLEQLRDVPLASRGAAFRCALVLALPDGEVQVFRGSVRGRLLEGPRGRGGFGYDPVFWSDELGKSFAEATRAEKQQVSHRGKALRELQAWLASDEAGEKLAIWRKR